MSDRGTRNGAPRRPDTARGGTQRLGLLTAAVAAVVILVALGAFAFSRGTSRSVRVRPGAAAHHASRRPSPATSHRRSAPDPAPRTAHLTLVAHRGAPRVPAGFFGLSLEYPALAGDLDHQRVFERVLAMLHAPGAGAMRLRIGGDSSQVTFLATRHRRLPHWAFAVNARFIHGVAALVAAQRLRVIFDLNQVTATPAESAALARRLLRGLPRGSVEGFELGNEPDTPHPALWAPVLQETPALGPRVTATITPAQYDTRYRADARAIAHVDRHVMLAGPALGEPWLDRRYIVSLLQGPHPRLGAITVHEYPYSACDSRRQSQYPTIRRLLSARAVDVLDTDIAPEVALARAAHLPLRVTEFNSVTCGGRRGVSDRFVTALWAPGALLELLRSGAQSADLHARSGIPNAPWQWTRAGLVARPLLYGMALFTRALGPGARLITTATGRHPDPWLGAWALRLGSGAEHLLLINRGPRPLTVHVRARRARRALIQRLTSAGPAADWARLDGQRIGADGRWLGRRRVEMRSGLHGHLTVTLPPYSAALATIRGGRRS